MRELVVALAKGRVAREAAGLFERIGCDVTALRAAVDEDSRSLVASDPKRRLTFLLPKGDDVPTYVEYGAADLGVAGKDVIEESDRRVAELLDLGIAPCSFVVAVPESSGIEGLQQLDFDCRVATKYPRIAERYFRSNGLQVEVIPLRGSMEVAPRAGLADAIFDLTETGRTLAENRLKVIARVFESSARLIANRISLKVAPRGRIGELTAALERVLAGAEVGEAWKRVDTRRATPEKVRLALLRPALHEVEVDEAATAKTAAVFGEPLSPAESVARILSDVEAFGDAAVADYLERIDGVRLDPEAFFLSDEEVASARRRADPSVVAAIEAARDAVRAFHERQRRTSWFETRPDGVIVGQRILPLDRVGCYVPGGRFPLASTAVMTVVPAAVAGVGEIIVATPCGPDGSVDPHLVTAAVLSGAHRILRVGGPQAIAALGYGTTFIPKVDKIVGPGNTFVQLAKAMVFGVVGIDDLKGPSEILVVADAVADAGYVAADLLSQAEHDAMAAAMLITPSSDLADAVEGEIERQLEALPNPEPARGSLAQWGRVVVCRDLDEAAELVNLVAPEHVEILVEDPWALVPKIRHAGAVFLGAYASEPIGDYVAGPSHVLPTNGAARFASSLGVDDFVRRSSLIAYTPEGLAQDAPAAVRLARVEGLEAHARALERRLQAAAQAGGEGRDDR